jgi:hypothetical protein
MLSKPQPGNRIRSSSRRLRASESEAGKEAGIFVHSLVGNKVIVRYQYNLAFAGRARTKKEAASE